MALIKNIALMGTSTAMRLACGLLTFVVMARLLGPDHFGLLMLWFSISTLVCLLANYGFTPYLLRELGANPASAVKVMSDVLTAKLILSTFLIIIGVGSFLILPASTFYLFILLLLAQLADSMTEFFNVGYRATNRYGSETQLATVSAVMQLVLVSGACIWLAKPLMAAAAFMVARLIVLMITWRSQLRYFSQLSISPWRDGWQKIKRTHAFASDFALQSLFGQIDSLVLNHFLGPASVGVYQAGMRVFLAGTQAATVLSNVFIPHISRAAESTSQKKGLVKLFFAFNLIGFLGFIFFVLLKVCDAQKLFGKDFGELNLLFPYFGGLFAARFLAGACGCILTIKGMQGARAACTALHWLILLLLIPSGIDHVKDWLILLSIANVSLAAMYTCVPLINLMCNNSRIKNK